MAVTLDILGVLSQAGVQNLREGDKEIGGSCPMHKQRLGRSDTHSSWSINKTTFLHNCFSCGYSGTLTMLLVDVQGYAPDDIEALVVSSSFRRTQASNDARRSAAVVDPAPTEWELSNVLVPVPERLLAFRYLLPEAAEVFGVRWDPKSKSWVLPVRSADGVLMGAQYRQKGVVLNRPDGLEKSVTLFGFHEMRKYDRVVLVESPLDAVRLFGLGIPALSSFGAWVSPQQVLLMSRNFQTVVMALDNDKVGIESTSHTADRLRKRGAVTVLFRYDGLRTAEGNPAKDVGDVPDGDDIVRNYNLSMSSPSFIPLPKRAK